MAGDVGAAADLERVNGLIATLRPFARRCLAHLKRTGQMEFAISPSSDAMRRGVCVDEAKSTMDCLVS